MTTRLVSVTTEPVVLADVMRQCRIDDDNTAAIAILGQLIPAVRQAAEQETCRSLALCTWDASLDAFPDEIELIWPPITAISQVTYLDTNGNTQILASSQYSLDNASEPGWLLPAANVEWPDTYDVANAVTVRYTAGYGTACPDAVKQWIYAHVKHHYDNPQAAITSGRIVQVTPYLDGLLDRYRIHTR